MPKLSEHSHAFLSRFKLDKVQATILLCGLYIFFSYKFLSLLRGYKCLAWKWEARFRTEVLTANALLCLHHPMRGGQPLHGLHEESRFAHQASQESWLSGRRPSAASHVQKRAISWRGAVRHPKGGVERIVTEKPGKKAVFAAGQAWASTIAAPAASPAPCYEAPLPFSLKNYWQFPW